jgi:hypothetical protein
VTNKAAPPTTTRAKTTTTDNVYNNTNNNNNDDNNKDDYSNNTDMDHKHCNSDMNEKNKHGSNTSDDNCTIGVWGGTFEALARLSLVTSKTTAEAAITAACARMHDFSRVFHRSQQVAAYAAAVSGGMGIVRSQLCASLTLANMVPSHGLQTCAGYGKAAD